MFAGVSALMSGDQIARNRNDIISFRFNLLFGLFNTIIFFSPAFPHVPPKIHHLFSRSKSITAAGEEESDSTWLQPFVVFLRRVRI